MERWNVYSLCSLPSYNYRTKYRFLKVSSIISYCNPLKRISTKCTIKLSIFGHNIPIDITKFSIFVPKLANPFLIFRIRLAEKSPGDLYNSAP